MVEIKGSTEVWKNFPWKIMLKNTEPLHVNKFERRRRTLKKKSMLNKLCEMDGINGVSDESCVKDHSVESENKKEWMKRRKSEVHYIFHEGIIH